jgi:thiazole/oxazole-forming peptide maturase SagD family component
VSGIHVTDSPVGGFFHALATFAPPLPDTNIRRLLHEQHAVGKGQTPYDAEIVAIAESLERYSIIFRGSEPCVRATDQQLDGLPPGDILLFRQAQFVERDRWNRSHSETQWIPEPFDPQEAIEWTPARSLVSGMTRYIPTAIYYMYYDFQGAREFCAADSNGCAAGRSQREAILNATLELIERDSVAIWWYNRLERPALDIESLGDARILRAQQAFHDHDRNLYVLDVTTDICIPACVAVAPKKDGSEPCFGCAADPSRRIAAYKAISEVAQISFWAATGHGPADLLDWIRSTSVHDHPYLRAHGQLTAPSERAMTEAASLNHCTEGLNLVGIEPFYVDLTRAEIGVPVVRLIAPGLRHFWARFAPDRLFTVPVKQGWLGASLSERELNPRPCMI